METAKQTLEAASAALWTAINAGKVGAELSPLKLAVLAAERNARRGVRVTYHPCTLTDEGRAFLGSAVAMVLNR